MVASLDDLSGLPYWPRFLSREQAAAYVGVSPSTFDDEVHAGLWPTGIRRGQRDGRVTWDRVALDRAVDSGPFASIMASAEEDDYERRREAHRAQQREGHKHRSPRAR